MRCRNYNCKNELDIIKTKGKQDIYHCHACGQSYTLSESGGLEEIITKESHQMIIEVFSAEERLFTRDCIDLTQAVMNLHCSKFPNEDDGIDNLIDSIKMVNELIKLYDFPLRYLILHDLFLDYTQNDVFNAMSEEEYNQFMESYYYKEMRELEEKYKDGADE